PVSAPPQPVSGVPESVPTSGSPDVPAQAWDVPSPYGVGAVPPPVAFTPDPFLPSEPFRPSDPFRPSQHPLPVDAPAGRTGLWIRIVVVIVALLAGGAGLIIWKGQGHSQPRPQAAPSSVSSALPAPLPTASPLHPGLEPIKGSGWPVNWPRFADLD